VLTQNINLAAKIASRQLFSTSGIRHVVTRVVAISKDPQTRKETAVYLIDSILRHVDHKSERLKGRYETHLSPHLSNIFKRALRVEKTRSFLANRFVNKFLVHWKNKDWFEDELINLAMVLREALPSVKLPDDFIPMQEEKKETLDTAYHTDGYDDLGGLDDDAPAVRQVPGSGAPQKVPGVVGSAAVLNSIPATPKTDVMLSVPATPKLPGTPGGMVVPMTPAACLTIPSTPLGSFLPRTPALAFTSAVPSTPVTVPRTPGGSSWPSGASRAVPFTPGAQAAAPFTPAIPAKQEFQPFTPRPEMQPMTPKPEVQPFTPRPAAQPFTPLPLAKSEQAAVQPFTPRPEVQPFTPLPEAQVGAGPGTPAFQPFTPKPMAQPFTPASPGAVQPFTSGSGSPSGLTPKPAAGTPASPGAVGAGPGTPSLARPGVAGAPGTPSNLVAPGTPGFIPIAGGEAAPVTPGFLGRGPSAAPGTPGFVPIAGGDAAPMTPAFSAWRCAQHLGSCARHSGLHAGSRWRRGTSDSSVLSLCAGHARPSTRYTRLCPYLRGRCCSADARLLWGCA